MWTSSRDGFATLTAALAPADKKASEDPPQIFLAVVAAWGQCSSHHSALQRIPEFLGMAWLKTEDKEAETLPLVSPWHRLRPEAELAPGQGLCAR